MLAIDITCIKSEFIEVCKVFFGKVVVDRFQKSRFDPSGIPNGPLKMSGWVPVAMAAAIF